MRNCPPAVDVPLTNDLKVPTPVSVYKVVLAYVICASIWGTTWHAIRICIAPGGYPVFLAAAIRFSVAALLLAPFCFFFTKRSMSVPLRWLLLAGCLSGCGYGLIYRAEENLTGGLAAVIGAAGPSLTLTFAALLKIEKNRWQAYFGSIMALIGIALTYHATMSFSSAEGVAVLLMLAVCILHAFSNIVIKKFGSHTHPVLLNTIYFSSAAISIWLFAIFTSACTPPSPLPLAPTLALAYLTLFGTLMAFASFLSY